MSRDGTLACARVVHSVARNDSTLEKVLAEPALLFTPPVHAIDEDDGLLTASEITELNLNADWVVLSACNTAFGADLAGNRADAAGLVPGHLSPRRPE